jgi:hypothetical protein
MEAFDYQGGADQNAVQQIHQLFKFIPAPAEDQS